MVSFPTLMCLRSRPHAKAGGHFGLNSDHNSSSHSSHRGLSVFCTYSRTEQGLHPLGHLLHSAVKEDNLALTVRSFVIWGD